VYVCHTFILLDLRCIPH